MDQFFNKDVCDRCQGSLSGGRIMSMFNTQTICMDCKDAETKRPDYCQAQDAEIQAVRRGVMNYPGIEEKSKGKNIPT